LASVPGTVDQLRHLLRDCVVSVGTHGGTGFLVSPALVLTCAHVLAPDATTAVVRWRGAPYAAVVLHRTPAGPGGGLHPPPDLALLRLTDPPDHPCALLADRTPDDGVPLVVAGHARVYQPDAPPEPFTARTRFGGEAVIGGHPMLRLTGDEIPPGTSGAPVLDTRTGAVCGIVKSARAGGPASGGVAVALRSLRTLPGDLYRRLWDGHDRYHADSGGLWIAVADTLASSAPLLPAEHRELRSLLQRLPPGADLAGLYRDAAGRFAREPEFPFRHYRDVLSDLGELVPVLPGELPPEMRCAAVLARRLRHTAAGRELRDWTLLAAGRLGLRDEARRGLGDTADQGIRPSILVRLQPSTPRPDRYRLTAWRLTVTGEVVPLFHDDDPLPSGRVLTAVQELLGRHLADADDDLFVEIAAPRALAQADFEGLTPWPGRPWSRLGRRHPVVLRDVERLDRPAPGQRWRARWKYLSDQDIGAALRGVECPDPCDHEMVEGWLEQAIDRAAITPPCSPGGVATDVLLEVGLASGVPVMLWRRGRCDHHGTLAGQACADDRLLAALRRAAAGTPLDELPELVRSLRAEAAARGEGDDHCGRSLVLLYDDPDRLPPRPALVTPEEAVRND
jgi:hypothetical protein